MKAIIGAKVHTMDGRYFENGYILIEGKKIKAVGDMKDFDGCNGEIFDAKGSHVMPGLVDAHCHVGVYKTGVGDADMFCENTALCQSYRAIDVIDPEEAAFSDAKNEGITTVVTGPGSISPIGGQFAALKTAGKTIDDMLIKSPCAMKISLGQNTRRFGDSEKIKALIKGALCDAKEYKENKKPNDATLLPLVPVIDGTLMVKVHAHSKEDIETALSVAEEFSLKLSIEHATDADLVIDKIKKSGAKLCIGPLITDRNKKEIIRHTPSLCANLEAAGLKFCIVTDHPELPVENLRLSMCLAIKHGLSKDAALLAVTTHAAEAIGLEDRIGKIAPGFDADIAIYDSHPCDFYANCTAVYIDGEKVK